MVAVGRKVKRVLWFGNNWEPPFLPKITFLCIGYLLEYKKTTKSKFGLLLVEICWRVKVGSGFSNPWGPTFLAQNNFFMHRLNARVQKNNKF